LGWGFRLIRGSGFHGSVGKCSRDELSRVILITAITDMG